MDEHKIPIEKLYTRIRSSDKGLTSQEANQRLEEYGSFSF